MLLPVDLRSNKNNQKKDRLSWCCTLFNFIHDTRPTPLKRIKLFLWNYNCTLDFWNRRLIVTWTIDWPMLMVNCTATDMYRILDNKRSFISRICIFDTWNFTCFFFRALFRNVSYFCFQNIYKINHRVYLFCFINPWASFSKYLFITIS